MPGELAGSDFGSGVQAISDNAGFDLYALRMSQAFGLGRPRSLTLSGEMRSATQMSRAGRKPARRVRLRLSHVEAGGCLEAHRDVSACSITAMPHRSFAVR